MHRCSYISFCKEFGFDLVPITPLQAGRYVAYLSKRLSPSSIPKYLNIIRIIHLEAGEPDPCVLEFPKVKSLLVGIAKDKGTPTQRMSPITPAILLKVKGQPDFSSLDNCSFWAACLVGFFSLLCKSNLFPPSMSEFDSDKHLNRRFLRAAPWEFVITLPWTKTIQRHKRILEVPLVRIPGHQLCPVSAIQSLLNLTRDANPSSPLFLRRVKSRLVPVLYTWFVNRLKTCLTKAGVDATKFGSHSFRRGGATWALNCDLPSEYIRILGDWKSEAYKSYLEVPIDNKVSLISRLFKNLPI